MRGGQGISTPEGTTSANTPNAPEKEKKLSPVSSFDVNATSATARNLSNDLDAAANPESSSGGARRKRSGTKKRRRSRSKKFFFF